jgi:hypothetical protein
VTALLEFDSVSKQVEAKSAHRGFQVRRLLARALVGGLLSVSFIVWQLALYRYLELLWSAPFAAFLIGSELILIALIIWIGLLRKA